ncbi:MAG: hypothetical protein AAFR34_04830 [Pseudomonadota bacterium]
MATVGSVLSAICAVYAAAGVAGVLVGAAIVDVVLRQIESGRDRATIHTIDPRDP